MSPEFQAFHAVPIRVKYVHPATGKNDTLSPPGGLRLKILTDTDHCILSLRYCKDRACDTTQTHAITIADIDNENKNEDLALTSTSKDHE